MGRNEFDVGQTVALSAAFTTPPPSNTPVDPSTVIVRIRTPDGASAAYETTHDGTGLYSCQYVTVQAGKHYFRFEGSGNLASAGDGYFETFASPTLE